MKKMMTILYCSKREVEVFKLPLPLFLSRKESDYDWLTQKNIGLR